MMMRTWTQKIKKKMYATVCAVEDLIGVYESAWNFSFPRCPGAILLNGVMVFFGD
jgi:hypothetical protein